LFAFDKVCSYFTRPENSTEEVDGELSLDMQVGKVQTSVPDPKFLITDLDRRIENQKFRILIRT